MARAISSKIMTYADFEIILIARGIALSLIAIWNAFLDLMFVFNYSDKFSFSFSGLFSYPSSYSSLSFYMSEFLSANKPAA